jgi:hypothetical protein
MNFVVKINQDISQVVQPSEHHLELVFLETHLRVRLQRVEDFSAIQRRLLALLDFLETHQLQTAAADLLGINRQLEEPAEACLEIILALSEHRLFQTTIKLVFRSYLGFIPVSEQSEPATRSTVKSTSFHGKSTVTASVVRRRARSNNRAIQPSSGKLGSWKSILLQKRGVRRAQTRQSFLLLQECWLRVASDRQRIRFNFFIN